MFRGHKLIAGTVKLQFIVMAAMICAFIASRTFAPKDTQSRLDAVAERMRAIETELDQFKESVNTNGVTAEDRKKFAQIREDGYEITRELDDIASGRTPRNFSHELFLGLLIANGAIVLLSVIFARRLDKPLEISVSKPAQEALTYHGIEE